MQRFGVQKKKGVSGFFDTIDTIIKKGTDVYNANAGVLDSVRDSAVSSIINPGKPAESGIPSASPAAYYPNGNGPDPSDPYGYKGQGNTGMSPLAIGGIVLGLVGIGTTVYFATKK